MIIVGFLPNISCEGKDFVATWFPGFQLLSPPDVINQDYINIEGYQHQHVIPTPGIGPQTNYQVQSNDNKTLFSKQK